MRLAPAVPLLGAAIAVGTIYACDVLAHRHGHIAAWFEYSQISLTGIHHPERSVYAVGFAISALVLYFAGRGLGGALEAAAESCVAAEVATKAPLLPEDHDASPRRLLRLLRQAALAATVAAAGLALQGAVPLASPACAPDFGGTSAAPRAPPTECSEAPEALAGALHALIGANAFFLGSFAHGYLLTSALASPAAPRALRESWSRVVKQACLGLALLGGFAAALLDPGRAVLAPPGLGVSASYESSLEHGGFAQRWAVAWLVAYWASFAGDMLLLGA